MGFRVWAALPYMRTIPLLELMGFRVWARLPYTRTIPPPDRTSLPHLRLLMARPTCALRVAVLNVGCTPPRKQAPAALVARMGRGLL